METTTGKCAVGVDTWMGVCVCVCVLRTCEEGVVVQAPLLVLMRTHVKQVRLDGPVDEICREIEQHDPDHHHRDGPDAPQ